MVRQRVSKDPSFGQLSQKKSPTRPTLVSTAAILKRPLRKEDPAGAEKITKRIAKAKATNTRVPTRMSKANDEARSHARNSKRSVQHPLSAAFSASSSAYQSSVLSDAVEALESVHRGHVAKLESVEDEALSVCSELVRQKRSIAPLSDEKLLVDSTNVEGLVENGSLGDQMEAFAKLVRDEGARMAELQKQWEAVNKELYELRREVLGDEPPPKEGDEGIQQRRPKQGKNLDTNDDGHATLSERHGARAPRRFQSSKTRQDHGLREGRTSDLSALLPSSPPTVRTGLPHTGSSDHATTTKQTDVEMASLVKEIAEFSDEAIKQMEREVRDCENQERKTLQQIMQILKQAST